MKLVRAEALAKRSKPGSAPRERFVTEIHKTVTS